MADFETSGIVVMVAPIPAQPTMIHVEWTTTWTARCHQVYLNDSLAWYQQTPNSPNEVILAAPPGQQVTIVVGAVLPENASVDYSASLNYTADNVKTLRFAADPNLWAITDRAEFYIELTANPAPGYTDANRLIAKPVFPGGAYYWGYGHGGYGQGGYGYGGANSIGFGNGPFGQGGFGFGCDWCDADTLPLLNGTYKAAARIRQADGDLDAATIDVETIVIDGPPRPPSDLTPVQFIGSASPYQIRCTFTESLDL